MKITENEKNKVKDVIEKKRNIKTWIKIYENIENIKILN